MPRITAVHNVTGWVGKQKNGEWGGGREFGGLALSLRPQNIFFNWLQKFYNIFFCVGVLKQKVSLHNEIFSFFLCIPLW